MNEHLTVKKNFKKKKKKKKEREREHFHWIQTYTETTRLGSVISGPVDI